MFSTMSAPSRVGDSPSMARAVTPPITASTTKLPTVGFAISRWPETCTSREKKAYSTTAEGPRPARRSS